MRGMQQLKKFAVWVRKTTAFKAVREQLVAIAEDEPDESTEYEGMVDFHCGSEDRTIWPCRDHECRSSYHRRIFFEVPFSQLCGILDKLLITLKDVRSATESSLATLDESFFKVRFDRCTPAEKRYAR